MEHHGNLSFSVSSGIQLSEANISVSKNSTTNKYFVIITVPLLISTGTGIYRKWSTCILSFSIFLSLELCFWEYPEYFEVFYESSQQHCSNTSSLVMSEAAESGNIWQLVSVVQLGDNCNYTIHDIALHNEAGETNSTGSLSIS